mgnify:CR=1 FL=1
MSISDAVLAFAAVEVAGKAAGEVAGKGEEGEGEKEEGPGGPHRSVAEGVGVAERRVS